MTGIKVFAPATVSNLACGFDILGFAIDGPGDEVVINISETPGISIKSISGDKGKLPRNSLLNCASVAALAVMDHLNINEQGLDMEIRKKMPFGSGLGSSAASAVAGAVAANFIFGNKLSKKELLPFISKGEQVASGSKIHLDNIAPSLLGGIILNRSNEDFDVCRVYCPEGIFCTVIYPHIQVLTKDSRNLLSDSISLSQHIQQSANLGGLLIGLTNSDFDLISRSLTDVIIEPQRAKLIPGFYEVKNTALKAGALGSGISGSGPSIFALCNGSLAAEECGSAMSSVFDKMDIESQVFISPINKKGAVVC